MTVLILHGVYGFPGIHWQQWLHDQLSAQGHLVIMPALPNADHPDRTEWLEAVQSAVKTYRFLNW